MGGATESVVSAEWKRRNWREIGGVGKIYAKISFQPKGKEQEKGKQVKSNRIFALVGAFFDRLARMLLVPLRGKAPYSVRLLRRPGERLMRQIDDRMDNLILLYGLCLGILVGGALVGRVVAALIPQWADGFWVLAAVVVLVISFFAFRRTFDRTRDYGIGYLAELKTAEFLERLGRPEWRVIHGFNLSAKSGGKVSDIDHIVVCPHGVFCVETKAIRKYKDEECNGALEYQPPDGQSPQKFGKIICINGHQDASKQKRRLLGGYSGSGEKQRERKNPLEQVKSNAGILRERLKGKFPDLPKFFVRRVVVCPGWRVIRKGKSWWEFVSSADDLESGVVVQFFAEPNPDFPESKQELDESTIVKIADFLENQVREEKKEINDPKPA